MTQPEPKVDNVFGGERRHAQPGEALAEPRARVERADLVEPDFVYTPGPIGGPIEPLVVDDDGNAVGRSLHVELDRVSTAPYGRLERRDGVLGRERQRAAMSDDADRTTRRAQVGATHRN